MTFNRRSKMLIQWELRPSFSVSQNEDRAQILFLMQEFFECGFIRRDYSDKTLKYEVRSLSDLINKVIPHFKKYPLLSEKQKDLEFFKRVCILMQKNLHRDKEGLQKIMNLVFKMNPSGKRKYTKAEMQKALR